MFDYTMEHICSYTVRLETPPEVIGPVPEGLRINAYVADGEVTGPRLQGKLRPVGGDWLTVRTDGVGILDVRGTIETHDGALIYIAYSGVSDLGEDGYEMLLKGEPPPVVEVRAVPRLTSSHPDYAWVNRLQYVNIGEIDFLAFSVAYDLYALR